MLVDLRKNKIFNLKQKLLKTDYKVHKYTEGFLSQEEFLEVKEKRQNWREEINRLEKMTEEEAKKENLIIEM